MEDDLLRNADEFLASGEENLARRRYNAAVSDFFKAVVILCDRRLYGEMRVLPKNHTERFGLLKRHLPALHRRVSALFRTYTRSYNLRSTREEAAAVKAYAIELRSEAAAKGQ